MSTIVKRAAAVVAVAAGLTVGVAGPASANGRFCSPAMGGAVAEGPGGLMACVDMGENGAFRWQYLA